MSITLECKPDWPSVRARWTAYWDRQATDRPCLDVIAPLGVDAGPAPQTQSPEQLWFDPDFVAQSYLHFVNSMYFGGEAVPAGPTLLGGWCFGCGPHVLLKMNTIYHRPFLTDIRRPLEWDPGPACPWRMKMEKVIRRLIEVGRGKFLVGYPTILPVNDLLMLFRGNEDFLMDLATDEAGCLAKMHEMLPRWAALVDDFRALIDPAQEGFALGWPGFWSPRFVAQTQSDMSCMISGDLFDRYVMTELDFLGKRYERVWYHLDGPQAVRHLPKLLSRPYMKVIQYVPGSGNPDNGPRYLELYRTVQAAGRGLDLYTTPANVEFLIRHLRPEGLLLRLGMPSPEQADELIRNAVKWCGSHIQA